MCIVVVTGGRHETRQRQIFDHLNTFHRDHRIGLLVEGGQMGVDRICRIWAKDHGVPYDTVEADWKRYGIKAGPRRNRAMAMKYGYDFALVFPGGNGTADMKSVMRNRIKHGLKAKIVEFELV
jgi:hypothetical protein